MASYCLPSTLTSQAPLRLHHEPFSFIVDPSTTWFRLIEQHSNECSHKNVSEGYNGTKRALSGAPPNNAYLGWDSQGAEDIKSDEESKPLQIAETMRHIQKHNFDKVALATLSLAQPLRSNNFVALSERSKLRTKVSSKTPSTYPLSDPHRLS